LTLTDVSRKSQRLVWRWYYPDSLSGWSKLIS